MLWKTAKSESARQSIKRADLQSAIKEAVREYDSDCRDLIDVIVERKLPNSQREANWAIKGIRFGRSDRQKVGDAIAIIVKRMQGEFALSEDATR